MSFWRGACPAAPMTSRSPRARTCASCCDQGAGAFHHRKCKFRNTLSIDLRRGEDEILAAMSGNTRRKIRVAYKKGLSVRPATIDDIPPGSMPCTKSLPSATSS